MIGAAAMIGAAMQAPLAALALVLELTHSGFGLMVPMMAATATATAVAFYVDGYSIYSARLPCRLPEDRSARVTAEPDHPPSPLSQNPDSRHLAGRAAATEMAGWSTALKEARHGTVG